MRTSIAIVVVLVARVAAADDYKKHMEAGNAAENKSKWEGALKEFEAALAAKPDDPEALAEIGFTAYKAGKLARAKEASTAAVTAKTAEPQLRGAALFNLGLAVEKAQPFAAASLMLAGYVLRPNAAVEKQLVAVEKRLEKAKQWKMTGDDAKLLATVNVDAIEVSKRTHAFHAPSDDALVIVLVRAGAQFEGIGMMKEQLDVTKLSCSETTKAPKQYECTATGDDNNGPAPKPRKLTGDDARAIALNLAARKIAGRKNGDHTIYETAVQCRLYDEQEFGSDLACTVGR